MIRFIISDVDGTLICNNKLIDQQAFKRMMILLKEKQIPFAVASGRTYLSLHSIFSSYTERLLYFALDGALAVCGGNKLCGFPIGRDTLAESTFLLKFSDIKGIEFCGFHTSYLLTAKPDLRASEAERLSSELTLIGNLSEIQEDIYKIILFHRSCNIHSQIPNGLRASYQSEKITELVRMDISKRSSAEAVCKAMNIAPSEILAYGDGENDRELLTYVKNPVTIYGAPNKVFCLAKHHTRNVAESVIWFLSQKSENC